MIDQATAELLEKMRSAGRRPLHELTPAEGRASARGLQEMQGLGPAMARTFDQSLSSDGESVRLRVLAPSEDPDGIIIYYHGGGWVVGTIAGFETFGRELAQRTRCAVVIVEYRLAPEHPYPAAADDAFRALEWVTDNRSSIASAGTPVIVMGDSAGGNLAAVVSQRAAAAGGPHVSLQVLVYPMLDSDLDTASYRDPENQLMVGRDTMAWFWDNYVPDPRVRQQPDASPGRSGDLAGLPAAVVVTAEYDVLRDEGEAYAQALADAGVPTALRRFNGQMHGFFTLVNVLPGALDGLKFVADEVERHLGTLATNGTPPYAERIGR